MQRGQFREFRSTAFCEMLLPSYSIIPTTCQRKRDDFWESQQFNLQGTVWRRKSAAASFHPRKSHSVHRVLETALSSVHDTPRAPSTSEDPSLSHSELLSIESASAAKDNTLRFVGQGTGHRTRRTWLALVTLLHRLRVTPYYRQQKTKDNKSSSSP